MTEEIVTILFLSGDPVSLDNLSLILKKDKEEIKGQIDELKNVVDRAGLMLLVNNEELSIVSKPKYADLVKEFWHGEMEGELTPASLQVLTLVAYVKGITREEISYIRGVQSSLSVRSLSVRGLIERQKEKCFLTTEALKHLGIEKVEDLPDYDSISKSLREKLDVRDL